ncbi:MAG: hypothetical protein C4540_04770 [Candidatus Omnitrophota bacterium]|nr:MAG: hypothetical protein C4540_04770 [Candidatus Omnitrophota bacterium]
MKRHTLIYIFLLLLSGCATLSSLPQTIDGVDFNSLKTGRTAMWTYEDETVFNNMDKEMIFLAAKHGLSASGFVIRKASFEDGVLLGYHDTTAHDWNVVAGVYIKQSGEKTAVKVIAKTSKDFSLVGNIGDTTSASWPQLIISAMQDYIVKESLTANKPAKHLKVNGTER